MYISASMQEGRSQAWPTRSRDADGRLTITAQVVRFINGIRSGQCVLYSVGEEDSPSTVYLGTAWDHNNARPKPLGRPSKVRALLETVHWDTTGVPSCTCDRGRLYFNAPCVHKVALQALEQPRLASHVSLQQGAGVVEAPCEGVGERVFGVYWNAGSPSPQRTMVHYCAVAEFLWYCEGRRSGCSKAVDCTHIIEAKRALERRGGVQRLSGSLFSEEQLDRALRNIGRGGLHGGAQHHSGGADVKVENEGPSFSELSERGPDAGLQKYLEELVVQGHPEAVCKGDGCFCKQHARIFGGINLDREPECAARCCSSASVSGKRGRSEQTEAAVGAMPLRRGKRRTKEYWAAKETRNAEEACTVPEGGDTGGGEWQRGASGVAAEVREAVMVPVCSNCVCPSNTCTHRESLRVAAVMPMEAEGIQMEVPKLVRPTDTWDVHDPEVALLRRPVRVSELTDRDFQELSTLGCLSAPCPRARPPCETTWSGLWQMAQIYSLQWSQEVSS
jgi:hypothetical protein